MNCTFTQMDMWNGKTGNKAMLCVLISIGVVIILALIWGLLLRA